MLRMAEKSSEAQIETLEVTEADNSPVTVGDMANQLRSRVIEAEWILKQYETLYKS